jgi:hypothetical protein
MTNLCRDEVTAVLKDKIESVFGSSFNTNGLGAVLTCGVTGIGAGLSHSPLCQVCFPALSSAALHCALRACHAVASLQAPSPQLLNRGSADAAVSLLPSMPISSPPLSAGSPLQQCTPPTLQSSG